MDEEWSPIYEFPNYSISNLGRVKNHERMRFLKPSTTRAGILKVGLMYEGVQHTRSLKVLVAEAFVIGRTIIHDTPIQLDGDQNNVRSDNLMWRPRWFAWKYARQFSRLDQYEGRGPLRDLANGHIYKDIVECGIQNGLLFQGIHNSIWQHSYVFPTDQQFYWVTD